jgi:hypothetical protein
VVRCLSCRSAGTTREGGRCGPKIASAASGPRLARVLLPRP